MTDERDTPIACTLNETDLAERVGWIAQLNRDALRTHRREGASLHLQYDAAVRDRVRELVRKESACCAFLAFAVEENADGISVTITVPDRARDGADELLAPFVPAGTAAGRKLSPTAMTTVAGVVACAACCALPIAPAAATIAGAGGALVLGISWLRSSCR